MQSCQQLASTMRPTHPLHAVVSAPRSPRAMKETLGSCRGASIAPHLSNGTVDPAGYRDIIIRYETMSLAQYICLPLPPISSDRQTDALIYHIMIG